MGEHVAKRLSSFLRKRRVDRPSLYATVETDEVFLLTAASTTAVVRNKFLTAVPLLPRENAPVNHAFWQQTDVHFVIVMTLDRRQLVAWTHGPYRVDVDLLFR